MSDDRQLPVRTVGALPVVSADHYSHMGKYAGAAIMTVFEMIGGVERMAAWADTSPESFYTKVMPKIVQRSTTVEHSGSLTIDDAITRLENQSSRFSGVVEDAEFSEYDL